MKLEDKFQSFFNQQREGMLKHRQIPTTSEDTNRLLKSSIAILISPMAISLRPTFFWVLHLQHFTVSVLQSCEMLFHGNPSCSIPLHDLVYLPGPLSNYHSKHSLFYPMYPISQLIAFFRTLRFARLELRILALQTLHFLIKIKIMLTMVKTGEVMPYQHELMLEKPFLLEK